MLKVKFQYRNILWLINHNPQYTGGGRSKTSFKDYPALNRVFAASESKKLQFNRIKIYVFASVYKYCIVVRFFGREVFYV